MHQDPLLVGNNSWKFHDDTMMGTQWKRSDGQTDRRTDWTNHRADWSQLKRILLIQVLLDMSHGKSLWIIYHFPENALIFPKDIMEKYEFPEIFQNRGHPVNGILLMDWCYMLKARIKTGIKTSCWPYTDSGLVVNKVKGPIGTCILCKVVGWPQWPKQADQKYKALPNESPLTQLRWRTVQIFHFS